MNADTLYRIYEITQANKATDLTIGLAMYNTDGAMTHEEDKFIREFIGRHGRALAAAFPDRERFSAAVDQCKAEDKALEEQANKEENT